MQVGIINASPLSMGLLTPQGPPDWHPAPPELREAAQAAADYCRDQNLDLAKLALQFAVRWVCVVWRAYTQHSDKASRTVSFYQGDLCHRTSCSLLPCAAGCRNPSISTTLVGMASSEVVQANVQAVLQALEVQPTENAGAEAKAFEEVERILAPVKNLTWPSGKPDNQ